MNNLRKSLDDINHDFLVISETNLGEIIPNVELNLEIETSIETGIETNMEV